MKASKKNKMRLHANKRKKHATQQNVSYETLEPRQMLATDLGLNLTGATFGNETNDIIADVTGDASSDWVIQAVNGHFGIFDRTDGVRVYSETLETFFESTGATIFDDLSNAQVVFDHDSQRWFAAAQGDGAGNWLHVAFSNTSDPTGVWQQLQFVGDSTGTHFNDDLVLSIDTDAVYMTTNNHLFGTVNALPDNVSVYSIPKVDVFAANPTLTNMSRFEELSTAQYGVSLQVAGNFEASDGSAVIIGKMPWEFSFLASVTRADISGADAAGAVLSAPQTIIVEPNPLDPIYRPARNPFQPADNLGGENVRTRDNYRISVAEANGQLFGAHTVTFDDKDDDTPNRNVVNWFEIDLATNQFVVSDSRLGGLPPWVQTRHIATPLGDAFNVSMDVNDYGIIALNYNTSGNELIDEGIDRFIGYNSTVGISANGLNSRSTQMENTVTIQAGLDSFELPPLPTTWSDYGTVRVDSDNINGFWGFQPWANTTDRWSAQVTNLKPIDMHVVIEADDLQNNIVIRRNAVNNDLIEVEIDGTVTDILPYAVLGTVEVRGYGGSDNFLIDYTNGDPIPDGGLFLDGGSGPDILRTNSPEGVEYIVNRSGGGTYNTISEFRGMEELFGWTGDDLFRFENLNPFTAGFIAGSANGLGGDDTFEFADRGSIGDSVNGAEGYNTLSFFDRAVPTTVEFVAFGAESGYNGRTVGGPIGDAGQAEDQFRDISNMIGGSIGGDEWTGLDQAGAEWFIDDEDSFYRLGGVVLDFSFWDVINGTSFVDTFNVQSNTLDPLTLNGLDSGDVYNFSSNAPTNTGIIHAVEGLIYANAGPGENLMFVSNEQGTSTDALVLSRRISGMGEIVYDSFGGTFDITMIGSVDNDTFSLHSFLPDNTLLVESRGGDDYFSIQDLSKAHVTVMGGAGDDTYAIEMIAGVSFRNLRIIDSVDAENDRVILVGTILDEVFTITTSTFDDLEVAYEGIESFGVEGRGGDDVFNIISNDLNLTINGEGGDDVFNFASDAPANMGDMSLIGGNVTIEGGTGVNQMNLVQRGGVSAEITIKEDQIDKALAGGGVLKYQATDGTFGFRESDGFGGIRFVGSEVHGDTVRVEGLLADNWLSLIGLGGKEVFTVRAAVAGDVWIGGGMGNDQYHMFVGAGSRTVKIVDDHIGDANRIEYFGSDGDDSIAIDSNTIVSGSDVVMTDGQFSFMRVNGREGNDVVTIDQSPARVNHVLGGDNNDTMTVLNSAGITGLRGVGGDGNDTFNFEDVESTTFSRAIGNGGNDVFNVSGDARGTVAVDGQAGDDTYNISLMRIGDRFVDTRDSVDGGQDETNVFGTNFIDAVEVRASRIIKGDQTVAFNRSNEKVMVDLVGGADTVDVFASFAPETVVQTGAGGDTILVSSTVHAALLKLMGGAEADTITVKKTHAATTTELHGEGGADTFIVGSSITQDNGNLGRIRGAISVHADNGTASPGDWLYVNDAAVSAAYSYGVTPTSIESIPGPRNFPRPQFAGITFDGTLDSLRLDGTRLANHFSVVPSMDTMFEFDGNDPDSSPANGDSIRLESGAGVLTITDPQEGNGRWDFSDGHERVKFQHMELWESTGASPLVGGNLGEDDDQGSGPMAMMFNPTIEVSADRASLAGMQDQNGSESLSEYEAAKMDYFRKLDGAVEKFDFDFDLI